MTLTGSCLCGAITYSSPSEPLVKALCHCLDCQKWAGSAYSSNAVVPRDSFTITKGTPQFYDATADSGKKNRHAFCPTCGSSLYTELEMEAMSDKTVIKAGTLDGGEASLRNNIDVEFYVKDRVPYLQACGAAKQEPKFI